MKKLACMLLVLSLLAVTASAENIKIYTVGDNLSVKASAQPGETVACVVAKSGTDVDMHSNVAGIHQAVADENGNVQFDFVICGDTQQYTVTAVLQNDSSSDSKCFNYIDSDTRNLLAQTLQNTADLSAVENIFLPQSPNRDTLNCIGINTGLYDSLGSVQQEVAQIIADTNAIADETALLELYKSAVCMASVNNNLDGALDEIADKVLFDGKSFSQLDVQQQNWMLGELHLSVPYTSVTDFYSMLDKAYALYAIKTSRFDEIGNTTAKYADKLEILNNDAYKNYLALDDTKKLTVNEKLTDKIRSLTAFSSATLMKMLGDAITEVANTSGSAVSGGGGTGGKGASGTVLGATLFETDLPKTAAGETDEGYSDLDSCAWAAEAIEALTSRGVISGDGTGAFRPNDNVTRGEFVKMIVSALKLSDKTAKCSFSDVPETDWSYSYVASGAQKGIINGISNEIFGKNLSLTREDMAVIIYRTKMLEYKNSGNTMRFDDDEKISDYAREGIYSLYYMGIVNGVSVTEFAPKQPATRAQAAKIIYEILK